MLFVVCFSFVCSDLGHQSKENPKITNKQARTQYHNHALHLQMKSPHGSPNPPSPKETNKQASKKQSNASKHPCPSRRETRMIKRSRHSVRCNALHSVTKRYIGTQPFANGTCRYTSLQLRHVTRYNCNMACTALQLPRVRECVPRYTVT